MCTAWLDRTDASSDQLRLRHLVSEAGARKEIEHIGVVVRDRLGAVLESDAMRHVFIPDPGYSEEERTVFYSQMTGVGALLVRHGVPVIFDATANRRSLREAARQAIPRFIEVYVQCPIEVCMARDPKGIYRRARNAEASSVPGLQTPYESRKNRKSWWTEIAKIRNPAARRIVANLFEKGYIRAR